MCLNFSFFKLNEEWASAYYHRLYGVAIASEVVISDAYFLERDFDRDSENRNPNSCLIIHYARIKFEVASKLLHNAALCENES